jgi:N-acyl-D-aspartate/D-glutamate deacylase
VTSDLFPYHAAATMMAAIFPPWALAGGLPALLAQLADRTARARIRDAVETVSPRWPPWGPEGWPHNLVRACGYARIIVARTGGATGGGDDGMSLVDLGRRRGTHPFEAVCDLMIEERGDVGQWIFGITGEEDEKEAPGGLKSSFRRMDETPGALTSTSRPRGEAATDAKMAPMDRLIASPFCAIATDACDYGSGLPHPAAYGSFPRVLARFVREKQRLSFPEAVRRMTGLPAAILGLRDRGHIAPGASADLVLLDPATVADTATFASPRSTPRGIVHVLVNGEPAVAEGELTGRDGGRLLRRTGS